MYTKFSFGPELQDRLVYIREVAVGELPEELRLEAGDLTTIYSVHDSAGQRLALVGDRRLAFALARQNDFAPVSVH